MGISKQFFFVILVLLISLFESCRGYSVAPNAPNYFTKAKQLNGNIGFTTIGASAQVNYSISDKYFLRAGTLASFGAIGPYGPKSTNVNGNIGVGIYSGNLRRCYMQTSLDFFSGAFESYYHYGDSYDDFTKLPGVTYIKPSYINAGIIRTSFMFNFPKSGNYFGPHLGGGFGVIKGVSESDFFKEERINYNQFISEFGLMYTNQSDRNTFFNFYLNASFVGQEWIGVFASASWTFKIVR